MFVLSITIDRGVDQNFFVKRLTDDLIRCSLYEDRQSCFLDVLCIAIDRSVVQIYFVKQSSNGHMCCSDVL